MPDPWPPAHGVEGFLCGSVGFLPVGVDPRSSVSRAIVESCTWGGTQLPLLLLVHDNPTAVVTACKWGKKSCCFPLVPGNMSPFFFYIHTELGFICLALCHCEMQKSRMHLYAGVMKLGADLLSD